MEKINCVVVVVFYGNTRTNYHGHEYHYIQVRNYSPTVLKGISESCGMNLVESHSIYGVDTSYWNFREIESIREYAVDSDAEGIWL